MGCVGVGSDIQMDGMGTMDLGIQTRSAPPAVSLMSVQMASHLSNVHIPQAVYHVDLSEVKEEEEISERSTKKVPRLSLSLVMGHSSVASSAGDSTACPTAPVPASVSTSKTTSHTTSASVSLPSTAITSSISQSYSSSLPHKHPLYSSNTPSSITSGHTTPQCGTPGYFSSGYHTNRTSRACTPGHLTPNGASDSHMEDFYPTGEDFLGPFSRPMSGAYGEERDYLETALLEAAEYFIPLPALRAIYSGSLKSIAELRQVTSLFLHLDSYVTLGDQDPISLQPFFYLLQQILSETGGFLRQFLVDDKVRFSYY